MRLKYYQEHTRNYRNKEMPKPRGDNNLEQIYCIPREDNYGNEEMTNKENSTIEHTAPCQWEKTKRPKRRQFRARQQRG